MSYASDDDPDLDALRCVVCFVEATEENQKGSRRLDDDSWACPAHAHDPITNRLELEYACQARGREWGSPPKETEPSYGYHNGPFWKYFGWWPIDALPEVKIKEGIMEQVQRIRDRFARG